MQTIRWLSFCISNTLTRTSVHFCPGTKSVSAPYPINCKLTLFGGALSSPLSVVVEGARLRQADGLRLEDAFAVLQSEMTGTFGLGIELSSPQGRIDLSLSQCIIEVYSSRFTSRFQPKLIDSVDGLTAEKTRPFLGLQDSLNSTSLVLVNGSEGGFNPCFEAVGARLNQSQEDQDVVAGLSVRELSLELDGTKSQEFSWGNMTAATFDSKSDLPKDVAGYIIYRDTQTKEPISISAL